MTTPKLTPAADFNGPTSGLINVLATGTPYIVPLFPLVCDCGVELCGFDECAAHECPAPLRPREG